MRTRPRRQNIPWILFLFLVITVFAICSNIYLYYFLPSLGYSESSDDGGVGVAPRVAFIMDPEHFPYDLLSLNGTVLSLQPPPSLYSNSSVPATLVVQLRGEMGNHLSCIAHGIGIQLWALQHYNLSTRLVLRHQIIDVPYVPRFINSMFQPQHQKTTIDSPKWIPTSQTIQQCFPAMAEWDFSVGSQWKEFNQKIWKAQQQRYDSSSSKEQQEQQRLLLQEITKINGRDIVGQQQQRQNDNTRKEPITIQDIDDGLSAFVQMWNSKEQQQWDNDNMDSSQLLSRPFLYSDSMDNIIFIERYLPFFRHIFRIDPSCCGTERPDPDESVFHFRNFAREFKGTKNSYSAPSFEEVSPNQTSYLLFPHLKKGDKVVITTRFYDDPILQEHVNALQSRGIQVRIVGGGLNNTKERQGIEDFCFLLHAKKELIGSTRSTFALWAAVLGQAENIMLYTIKSPALTFRFGPFIKMSFTGNYTWNLADGKKHLQMVLLPMDRTRIT